MKQYFFYTSSLFLLGCNATVPMAQTTGAVNTPKALTSYQSKGEMFEINFTMCNPKCHSNLRAATWGRPTQVGFLYYNGILGGHESWLKPIAKMPNPSKVESGLFSKIVFKSSGAVPPLSDPSREQKFAPVFAPGPTNLTLTSELQNSIKNSGRLEIVSIRRMTIAEEESKVNQARAMPRGIAKAGESLEAYSLSLWNYYQAIKDKSEDIKPQQVENINWQEGQSPQIIPIRAW